MKKIAVELTEQQLKLLGEIMETAIDTEANCGEDPAILTTLEDTQELFDRATQALQRRSQ